MTIKPNILNHYVDLLRMDDSEERTPEQSETCVTALHNVISTMRLSRRDKICGEDFSHLDFGNIPFNGVNWSMDGEFPSCFDRCRLTALNFMSGHMGAVRAVTWSRDGKYILTGSDDNNAILWNAKTGIMIRKMEGHTEPINAVAFSMNGDYCITGSNDESARIWSTETGECFKILENVYTEKIKSVAFINNDTQCITGLSNKSAIIWDLYSEKYTIEFYDFKTWRDNVVFSLDGKYCIADNMIYSVEFGNYINSLKENYRSIISVAFSFDGKYCITADHVGKVKLWNVETGENIQTFEGHDDFVSSVAISNDGKYCLTGSQDNTARLWDSETGKCLKTFKGHFFAVIAVSFSYDGKYFITGSLDNSSILWDVKDNRPLRILQGYIDTVRSFDISLDGEICLTGGMQNAKCWNLEEKRNLLKAFSEPQKIVSSVAISPDKKHILTSSWNKNATLHNLENFNTYYLVGHTDDITTMSFSNDGKYILTGSWDNTVKLWDIKTKECIHTFKGHMQEIIYANFSNDTKYIISVSQDKTAKIWDSETGNCLITLEGHSEKLIYFDISHDNQYLLTASIDMFVRIWDIKTHACIITLSNKRISDTYSGANSFVKFSTHHQDCLIIGKDNSLSIINYITGKNIRDYTFPLVKCKWKWRYPFLLTQDRQGLCSCYRINEMYANIDNPLLLLSNFYNINSLYFQNCHFNDISADPTTRKILYQYGGITDPDSE